MPLSRRRFLQLGGVGALVVGGGVVGTRFRDGGSNAQAAPIGPTSVAVAEAEAARATTGQVVRRSLRAAPATIDLGGRTVQTWAFDGSLPGTEIRATVGDELRVILTNDLPEATSIHWHGVALRNDMDGVPGVTQDPVEPGGTFEYRFVLPHAGSYFFHPHVGVQLDRGLQAPLVVEDPAEPANYDEEVVLVLDDWTDGLGAAPDDLLAGFRRDGMSMNGMSMGDMDMGDMGGAGPADPQKPLGDDTGDVAYPAHLINGRLPAAPFTVTSAPGRRIRFRMVNSGGDTAYRLAIGGHRLTVTHADGFPVRPVDVDSLIIGMGERYDVVVTAGDGAFPIVAFPEGKDDPAGFALLRTASGRAPAPDTRPTELTGRLLSYSDLSPTDEVALPSRSPDRTLDIALAMGDGGRRWLINGKAFPDHEPLDIRSGERVRLVFDNQSMMFHPMHLHGHTFAVADQPGRGLRKDTVNVLPMQKLAVDFDADNPGQWLVHCHNVYHAELGMTSVVSYLR
ncbi:multicopper oxidase family protein [Modestobacter muralis]|uniref:Multicopper oxidase family protein n=1 Tax=Modestobacter muralis TaxID=1608614 RepID=A0A6P0HE56_9ACTN|nr:multicopper oxidase family protein [Modestobacter muralis]NEK95466.1 multicopper oxidase family protein [Modestobacter muralis]NEN52354.1 multicopper oxidase family protein [Modestobacter muralis]